MIQTNLTVKKPIDFYTALQLVLFRDKADVGLKEIVNTLSSCKLFYEYPSTGELEKEFWQYHVLKEFNFSCYNNEHFKTNAIWKNLFWKCSTEKFQIKKTQEESIEITSQYCLQIIESQNIYINKKDCYPNLQPIERYLSEPRANKIGQYCLGVCYASFGDEYGVKGNQQESFKYFKLSADQNYSKAQVKLSSCYMEGRGVDKNKEEALKYVILAANQKDADAQDIAGTCYYFGNVTDVNMQEAFRYFQLSADQGNASGQNNVAFCHQHGYGTEVNVEKALKYYKLSAGQGYQFAITNLTAMLKNV